LRDENLSSTLNGQRRPLADGRPDQGLSRPRFDPRLAGRSDCLVRLPAVHQVSSV
jgi:hypothetical protein